MEDNPKEIKRAFDVRSIYVTVRIDIHDDAETQDVLSDMEYAFEHPDIVDTEIVDVNDEA